MALPRYSDCEYSLFVSYAHDDDQGNNGWVSALKDAFWKRLQQLPRDVPRLNLHLSAINGPVAGRLGTELEQRVRRSFGMVIVVGPQYVDSGWCERELELFQAVYGAEGFGKRLFIVAMTERAYRAASGKQVWKNLVPQDQTWRPFYREDSVNEPLDPRRDDDDTFTIAFWREVSLLGDRLISEIKTDAAQGPPQADSGAARVPGLRSNRIEGTPRSNGAAVMLRAADQPIAPGARSEAVPGRRAVRVLIGAATGDLSPAVTALAEKLREGNEFEVSMLTPERVSQWEREGELAPLLAEVDVLIAPFSGAQPLNPAARAGGHLAIEQLEWTRAGKPGPLLWFRPLPEPDETGTKASEKHRAFINELSPVYASDEALETALLGRRRDPANVLIYIEKNPAERRLWKILGERIAELWEELQRNEGGEPLGLRLRPRSLDIDKLGRGEPVDDADGVVLLFGNKHPKSLREQINRVEDAIQIGGRRSAVFPGFIAVLVPPHPPDDDDLAEHGWDYYRFRATNDPPPPQIRELRSEDTEDVKMFLREIRDRCRQRMVTRT